MTRGAHLPSSEDCCCHHSLNRFYFISATALAGGTNCRSPRGSAISTCTDSAIHNAEQHSPALPSLTTDRVEKFQEPPGQVIDDQNRLTRLGEKKQKTEKEEEMSKKPPTNEPRPRPKARPSPYSSSSKRPSQGLPLALRSSPCSSRPMLL